MNRRVVKCAPFAAALVFAACGSEQPKLVAPEAPQGETQAVAPAPKTQHEAQPSPKENPVQLALSAPSRSVEDRGLDAQRAPEKMLEFFQIAPGQKVAELAVGKGYTAELLARVVGPTGTVFAQNNQFILERFAEVPWSERLKKPEMANVIRVDRELESPFPSEAKELDAVLLVLFYHDTVWFKTDRAAMNQKVFEALRPGGIYGIVDHSARPGDGVSQTKSLHRIEESTLRAEIEAAGFHLAASADFLRNAKDARDWSASPSSAGDRRGESDRFVLKFIKPASTEKADEVTECTEPRSPMCTRDYRPVCAELDTGVRCVKAPCPSTEKKTYSNACTACADNQVLRYRSGACE